MGWLRIGGEKDRKQKKKERRNHRANI